MNNKPELPTCNQCPLMMLLWHCVQQLLVKKLHQFKKENKLSYYLFKLIDVHITSLYQYKINNKQLINF